jgi:hypothetical protein
VTKEKEISFFLFCPDCVMTKLRGADFFRVMTETIFEKKKKKKLRRGREQVEKDNFALKAK